MRAVLCLCLLALALGSASARLQPGSDHKDQQAVTSLVQQARSSNYKTTEVCVPASCTFGDVLQPLGTVGCRWSRWGTSVSWIPCVVLLPCCCTAPQPLIGILTQPCSDCPGR